MGGLDPCQKILKKFYQMLQVSKGDEIDEKVWRYSRAKKAVIWRRHNIETLCDIHNFCGLFFSAVLIIACLYIWLF